MADASLRSHFSVDVLEKRHARETFCCGEPSLDDYLKRFSFQDRRRHLAATYVMNGEEQNEIAGFYTLSATSIALKGLSPSEAKKFPNYPLLPATLIGRLAIDKKYRGKGLGEELLINALERSFKISSDIASMAVVVDALNDSAVGFYQKYGFEFLKEAKQKLYLPMKTIKALF